MFKREEVWITITEVILPPVTLCGYAAIAFIIMTAPTEVLTPTSERSHSEANTPTHVSVYHTADSSWSSLTTEGCADYTHPAPRDWSDYA